MKKISLILLTLFLALTFTSCKKFLDVQPKTRTPQDVLFNSEDGYKDALAGLYIQMKANDAYGLAMTQTTIERLISSWDVVSNTTDQRIGLFNFGDAGVQNAFQSIFEKEYSIIANTNALLSKIDDNRSVFKTQESYAMIKAEALAIRAYCHLDILRLFGPVPTTPTEGNQLAYVLTVSKTPTTRIPFDAYKELLLKDLNQAEELVNNIDPIQQYSLAQLKSPGNSSGFDPNDTYFAYRYLRMNYYAIKALKARAYLWFGDKTLAFNNAKVIIDAKNADGTSKFRFGTAADMATSKDYVLTTEHIFGLYDFDMFDKYTNNYNNGNIKKGTAATTITTTLYGNTGTDIREANLWQLITLANGSRAYVLRKFLPIEDPANLSTDFKQIPMLRLSEMYLIAAETAPLAEAQTYWNTFRTARNISASTLPTDPTQLQLEIVKELRKEFYGEGQAFFAYKRINAPRTSIVFAPAAAAVNYVVPLPLSESN
ncbi:RagB/SusD family nutrient uptake outer membrane protein [Pedobacter sp. MW01-1-1]|uniref:RagB/SusD family nutrient uptake outer membrane protein n=1 Tax=Pedobacter sp. MW01-1-1 TaxID=3383027 RepID=UPI003FEDE0D6